MSADPLPSGSMADVADVEPRDAGGTPLIGPQRDVRASAWWWIRAAAITVTLFAGYQLLLVVSGFVSAVLTVVLYVVFGAIVAFIAGPAVDALNRFLRIPRTLAILAVLLGALGLIALAIYLAAGPAVDEARSLANQVPGFIDRGSRRLDDLQSWLRSKGVDINLGSSKDTLVTRVRDLLLSSITGTVRAVVDVVVVFVVAFWLLKDGDQLRSGLISQLPSTVRANTEFALDAVGVVIGGYVRAQLLLAAIIGLLAGVGCAIIGVPFPLVVALAAGVFELVPILGPFLGGAVAVLLALTVSPFLALLTVFLFLGIHVIEGYVLAPRIQARFVQLHPLVALLALFAGIEAGGFLGALFAVPAASLAAVFVRAVVGDWRASRPDLFAARRADLHSERRRETILGEFRFFKRSPWAVVRARLRGSPREEAGASPDPPPVVGGGAETRTGASRPEA